MITAVLIVEDNATKREEIERALVVPGLTFEVLPVSSIANAYRALDTRTWDLIVLDMTFQVSQSVGNEISKEALAGVEILQFIARKRAKSPVIVATQHSSFVSPGLPGIDSIDKLHALLTKLFPRNYKRTVFVDLAGSQWRRQFQAAVAEVLDA